MDVPEDDTDMHLHHSFCFAVQTIKDQPERAFTGDCIVCRQQHTFDNCPILKDIEFLKNHYVRFCQLMRKNQASMMSRDDPNRNRTDVNYVDSETNYIRGRSSSLTDEDSPITADFQRCTRW